ncbi:hypothetical protein TTHERM_01289190 (macronuclear) [Tetrahymena thermophila SB210]|uniref:Uncharacterized protein n=1 Tax=Tetrahymena thermophila (strain SB210) TaxID=312017 RepID=Q22A22_TETTS|nr:hypothetical protein TTHERM_01289190 [Tetrahymena thermophila SB210]EAR82157.1 hypothetical protein TTHERM_01289190 [Tetrahymena thermophila SB210]|eukprot:XP_001029821.1 hypothetical protein TTHERM_01289190 [Tetrahymena thermophila SB210]
MNNIKTERIQSSKQHLKVNQKQDFLGQGGLQSLTHNQFFSPQASAQSIQRRKSGFEGQNGSQILNNKLISENSKIGSYVNSYRQFDMNDIKQNPANYALRNFQPTLKPIPNLNFSPQKKGYSNKNSSKDEIHTNGQEFQDHGIIQAQHHSQKNLHSTNMLMKLTQSPLDNSKAQSQKMLTESNQNTNRLNQSNFGSSETEPPKHTRIHTTNIVSASQKNYFYSPVKYERKINSSKGEKTANNIGLGARSVSNLQHYKRKLYPNNINSLNNINDFEDTQIFQDFQKPQAPTQGNEIVSQNIQNTESSQQQINTLQSIPAVKKDTSAKQFTVKTKSASQLQTLSGFQKLLKVKKALALGSKVTKFLEIVKQQSLQRHSEASEQYSKECIQILKGMLEEKEQEADQLEQVELEENEKDQFTDLDLQKGIKKKTEKLTKKVLRTIQDAIIEPISQKTYRALYYEKCKEVDRIKFTYKDMEKEVEVLRKSQKVFDDIAANYFRKTEVIEKEKQKLSEEKKLALLEVERLEKKLDESNNYYNFWQGEYHQVNKKYNEEVYALNQYQEKMKKEKTEKTFLENQLSSLQKQIETRNSELEKIKTTQVQLKWMKGSISTYQQDLLNKNIQINLCKDLVVSKAEALQLISKEELDKDQPLIDLIKSVFHSIAVKLS